MLVMRATQPIASLVERGGPPPPANFDDLFDDVDAWFFGSDIMLLSSIKACMGDLRVSTSLSLPSLPSDASDENSRSD